MISHVAIAALLQSWVHEKLINVNVGFLYVRILNKDAHTFEFCSIIGA